MVDQIVTYIVDFLPDWLPGELITFIVSVFPVLECRGGMFAAKLCGVDSPIVAFIVCYLGNILPIPFILIFIKQIFAFMKKHNILTKLVEKLETKTLAKRDKIDKIGPWGLLTFVAIPLPGTGGWTGSLLAALLDLKFSKAFPVIAVGVLIADFIMAAGVYGITGLLSFLS